MQQVERQQQHDSGDPRGDAAHQRATFFTQPGDKTGRGEAVGQRHQRCEPDKGVPCRFIVGDIAPRKYAGPQHQHNHQQGGQRRFNPLGGENQHGQGEADEHQQQDLIARQLAQFFQLTSGPQRHFVVDFHFRRIEPVSQQRHSQNQQDTQRQEGDKPGAPRDIDANDAFDQREGQQVWRQRGEEHRTGDTGGGNGHPHQVGADSTRAGIVWFRTVQRRQVGDNRVDCPAAARGIGRGKRCQQQVSKGNGITQRQAAAAQILHQDQRQTATKLGFIVASGEHEGAENQPDGGVTKTADRPFKRGAGQFEFRVGQLRRVEEQPLAAQGDDHHPGDTDHGARQGFKNQPDNNANEDSKVVPGIRR